MSPILASNLAETLVPGYIEQRMTYGGRIWPFDVCTAYFCNYETFS
jgi:hypothetical protein